MSNAESIGPCKLTEGSSGQYSLLFYELDTTAAVFEAQHHLPNGYAWEGVVRVLLAERSPESLDRFNIDSEADMFCAYGTDPEALREVGRAISDAVADHELLAAAIARATRDNVMD
jgi:hypothetical protein